MPRIKNFLGLLPVLALSLYIAGCGSSSTAPQTTPSQYAGSYQGIVAGAGGSGTVAITVGQVSTDLTRGPVLHAEGGNPDVVTVTLATATGSITLTGTISGNVATVTSTTPPATCTITFTTTGASGSCTEAPYGTLSLIAFVLVNGIEATVYCGTQSAGLSAAIFPTATLGAVVSGPNMYLVVAPPTGTPTLYSGTITSNSVSLTSTSSGGAVYSGTVTGTASISGTITSGGEGAWAVSNPCSQGALTVSTNAVTASSSVGSTTTITPTPVTITNSGGSGSTLGVLGVGAATYSPSATSGWLQASLTSPTIVSGTLSLSITPPSGIAAGTYTAAVPITASLGTGSPQTVTVTLTITSGVTITSPSPLSACVDLINCNNQLTAMGGSGTYTWSLATGSSLPSWLTLSPGGLLSGTAPAGMVYPANAPLTFSVAATDGTTSSTKQFQLVVYANVTITSTSPLPTAYFGVPYSYQFTATGGPTSNYGWALSPGSGLPAWLSLSVSGVLSGTPPAGAATPVTFTIAVASGGSTAGLQVSLPITTVPPVMILTTTLPPGTEGVPYGPVQLMGTGGPNPANYAWTLSAGSNLLPAGLTLSLSGVISGTPTVSAPAPGASFTITLADGGGLYTAAQPYMLVINPASAGPCVISPSTMPPFYIGAMVDFQMIGSAGCGATQTWSSVASEPLPPGLSIGPEGVLFGSPTTAGIYTFAVRVQNTATQSTTEVYTNVPVDLSTSCALWPGAPNFLPNGTVGTLYPANSVSATPACTTAGSDNTALWVWSISGGAPPGLSLSPANGTTITQLVGTPTGTGGTYTFTVTFTNTNQVGGHNEASMSQSYTVTIAP